MDYGAAGHVMPETMSPHVKLERKTSFVAANGEQIKDLGERPWQSTESLQWTRNGLTQTKRSRGSPCRSDHECVRESSKVMIRRESTQPLTDLEEKVENTTLTAPVVAGSAPTEGGSSSSTDVLISLNACEHECRGHGKKKPASHPSFQFWYTGIAVLQRKQGPALREIDESCVDIECGSREAQQRIGARSCEHLLGDVCIGLITGVAADLVAGWNLETIWRPTHPAAKRKTEGLDSQSAMSTVLGVAEPQQWELKSKQFHLRTSIK